MTGLLFLFGVFLALGLFCLAAASLLLPTTGASRAMLGAARQEKKAAGRTDVSSRKAVEIHPDG